MKLNIWTVGGLVFIFGIVHYFVFNPDMIKPAAGAIFILWMVGGSLK